MDLKSIVAKIAASQANQKMGLGKAFSDIAEPIEKLDGPVNKFINSGAQKFGQLTDLTGGADKDHQARAASAFNIAANLVAPTPSNLIMGGVSKVLPIMKAVKPSAVAGSMNAPKSAAELFREAKAANKAGFGTVVVKDSVPKLGTVTVKP
jgi:hypothetical protein